MTQETALLIMVGVVVVLLGLMAWGWWRRSRRDRALTAPIGQATGEVRARFSGLYVATTRHDAPLDRLAVHPLAFRSKVTVTVTDAGVALDLPGASTVFLPTALIDGAGRATWTIDRVVERDGLVMLAWHASDDTIADSYLRLQGADPDALVDAIEDLRHPHLTTGADR